MAMGLMDDWLRSLSNGHRCAQCLGLYTIIASIYIIFKPKEGMVGWSLVHVRTTGLLILISLFVIKVAGNGIS